MSFGHSGQRTFAVAMLMGTLCATATAQSAGEHHHGVVAPSSMKWVDVPSLPPGAKLSVLEGSMSEPVPFTARLRLPANYRIPAHWHPGIERVTVLSGTFYMGTGDALDAKKGVRMAAGGFAAMPAKVHHYAYTLGEPTEIQLHSTGPWGITYLDPADDPRRKP
jgi:hypothetical protein